MKNWSTNVNSLKVDPIKYTIWKLEQMVNFGLDKEKLNASDLKKYWQKLNLDPDKKKYLSRILQIHD